MAADPLAMLATLAAIIMLGFLGYLLFERTRVSDVLLLIGVGLLVGPVLNIVSVEAFQDASALVGTLALIVIMFDGGLGLELRDLMNGFLRAGVLAVLGFGLTVAGIAAVGHYAMGMDWMTAALLGAILGGTSGVIIIPLMSRISARRGTSVLMSVDSALTDVLCVIGAVTIMGILTAGGGALDSAIVQGALKGIAAQFSVATVLGLITGFGWLRTLKALQHKKNSYMLTLAAVLALYAGTEVVGGNGSIAVLVFGVVLGNGWLIMRKLDLQGMALNENQRQFQGEISFLIRVFFFVYLGIILDPAVLANPAFLAASGILLAAIVGARVIAVHASTWGDAETRPDRALVTWLMPRGLAATVLAGLPAQAGIAGTESFLAYAFIVVVATNLVGTVAVLLHERRRVRLGVKGPAPGVAQAAPVRR